MKTAVCAGCILSSGILFVGNASVPLENWRFPYFDVASEFEISDGSISRMFWDAAGNGNIFDSILWMNNDRAGTNHWLLEPAVSGGINSELESKKRYFHGELFNEIKYTNITARQLLHVDSRYDDDPYYPAHPDRAFRGRIEEATLQADWKNGFIRIGRQNRNWGPFPDRSMLLSSYPYTYDAIEFQVFSKVFEFRHLFAPFVPVRSSIDSDNGNAFDRYLTAHSLNIILGKWVTFGITETVLFTRNGSMPDLQYVNPVSVYSVINTNCEGNGNLMLGFQWNIHPGIEALSIRGQLILDDFQVDNEIATDEEPTHWGLDAGIYWSDPLPMLSVRHLVKVYGTYASPWLYTVPDDNADKAERYIYNRRSLGFPENDMAEINAGFIALVKSNLAGECKFSYEQHGGNCPLTSWGDRNAVYGLPVDTDLPVEKRFAVGMKAIYNYRNYISVIAHGDLGWIHNIDNARKSGYEFDPSITVECSMHFSNFAMQIK